MKVRKGGWVINAVVLVATGVNADGRREVLRLHIATCETVPAWNTFFADLVPAASPVSTWSPLTPSGASSKRSQQISPALPGRGVETTTRQT
jgi:hypothetical protein